MVEDSWLELLKVLFDKVEIANLKQMISFSDVIALLAFAVSFFTYRLQKKGNNTFKESLMSDAYQKSQEFIKCLNNIENALFYVSRMTIGGVSISSEYGKFYRYKNDEKFRNGIVNKMKCSSHAGVIIASNMNLIVKIDSELQKVGYTLSKSDTTKLKGLFDLGLKIDADVRQYVDTVFDYFDDKEHCGKKIRMSRHIIPDESGQSVSAKLENSLDDCLDKIFEHSDKLSKICAELNQKKIVELYQQK